MSFSAQVARTYSESCNVVVNAAEQYGVRLSDSREARLALGFVLYCLGRPLTLIETNYYLYKSARDAYRSYMLAYHTRPRSPHPRPAMTGWVPQPWRRPGNGATGLSRTFVFGLGRTPPLPNKENVRHHKDENGLAVSGRPNPARPRSYPPRTAA